MPRLSRPESQARTRARILEAARELLARQGLASCSVDAISEQAGFSKGAFYSNFDSKEAVFLELLREHTADEQQKLSAALQASTDPKTALRAVSFRIAKMLEDPLWCRLSLEAQLAGTRNPKWSELYSQLQDAELEATVAMLNFMQSRNQTRVPKREIRAMARSILTFVYGLKLVGLQTAEPLPQRSRFIESNLAAILRPLIAAGD